MSPIIPFDHNLVTSSVNYHGHQLLKQLVSDNASQIHSIQLQDIDYKLFQSRYSEIRNLGSSRVQEMIDFIASYSEVLLVAQPVIKPIATEESYKERYQHQLPLEYFMEVDRSIRLHELSNLIEKGDILFVEVAHYLDGDVALLRLLAFDRGKHRYFSDLKPTDLRLLMRLEDTIISNTDEDRFGRWMGGTRLRVEVLDFISERGIACIFVGTKGITIADESKDKIKLGKIQLQDLPPALSIAPDPSLKFLSQSIATTDSYKNPECIRQLASQMGIDLYSYSSLMSSLRGYHPDAEKPRALRKAQMCKWAHKSVADGVTYFKKGQHEEAFQCLNKALQIDHENVEAFVAKGALLANLGKYEKAIDDFEKALKFNSKHINARKYMCETLIELGKQHEEKNEPNEALRCYSKCLNLNENHIVAKEGLKSVMSKLGPKPEIMKYLQEDAIEKKDPFLEDLLQMETELKIKKELDVQLSSEAKENALSFSFTTIEKSDCTKEEKEKPLSPMSQNLSSQQNLSNQQNLINHQNVANEQSITNQNDITSQQGLNQQTPWNLIPPVELPPNFMSIPPPSFCPSLTAQESSVGFFSNPPPNWPLPPPQPVVQYSEDAGYKARVEQFLKELDSRSRDKSQKRSKSRAKVSRKKKQSKAKDKHKQKKRRRHSANSSSTNSSETDQETSSSDSSNSSSDESSSSTSSNSSSRSDSDDSHHRKARKHTKKETQKKERKSKQDTKCKQPQIARKPSELEIPDFMDLEKKLSEYYKKMEAMKTPQYVLGDKTGKGYSTALTGLKRNTHPAFLENSDTDEEISKTAAGKCGGSSLSKNRTSRWDRSKSLSRSSCSPRPGSKHHSRRRSNSGSPRRSSPSKSSRHKKRHSSRSHSRDKHRRRDRSPSHSRPISHSKDKVLTPPSRKSKSPPFGYYHNRPYYSNSVKQALSDSTSFKQKHSQSPPKPTRPTKCSISQPLVTSDIPVKFDVKKMQFIPPHAGIHRNLITNSRWDKSGQVKSPTTKGTSPDPSTRFGKWAKNSDTLKTQEEALNLPKAPLPEGSLDQFENYLVKAKERSRELMKERNKVFLKPRLD